MFVPVLLSLLALELVSTVQADDHDDHWKPAKREFKIKFDNSKLQVEAEYKNKTYEDKFRFEAQLDHDWIVDFRFKYENHVDKNKTKLDKIIEFESTSKSAVYEGDEKLIVSYWPMKHDKLNWGAWQDESKEVDGVNYYQYSSACEHMTVRVRMAASPLNVKGLAIDPNSVKIDFEIHGYPYARNNDTRLAFETWVKSKSESKYKGSRSIKDYKIIFNDDPALPLGSFSWVPTAEVNTTNGAETIDVVGWSPDIQKGKEFLIYYTFVTSDAFIHASPLVWDPTVGLDYDEPAPIFCLDDICGGAAVGLIAGLLAGVVFVAIGTLLLYSYRKRRSYQSL